jgi:hypothetical protein
LVEESAATHLHIATPEGACSEADRAEICPHRTAERNQCGPVRDNPFELPETTPPALLTSMLFAKATKGTARVRTARHTTLLHIDLPPTTKVHNQGHSSEKTLSWQMWLVLPSPLVDKAAFKHCHKMYEGLDRIDSVLSRSYNRT